MTEPCRFKGSEDEGMALMAVLMANDASELIHDQRALDWLLWLRRYALRFFRDDMVGKEDD